MAYIDGFEHDLFISYARVNDLPDPETGEGWVTSFLKYLEYDTTRLVEGLALISAAEDQYQQQQTEYAEQFQATTELQEKAAAARATYLRHLKLARVAFKSGTLGHKTLNLAGKRKEDFAGWMAQANQFYRVLLEDTALLQTMSGYTLDQAAAEAAKNALVQVEIAGAAQLRETGEAQVATRQRDDAVTTLRGFMSDFYRVAEVATEDQPQLREKMGMLERS